MTIDVSEVDVMLAIIKKYIDNHGGRGKFITLGMLYDIVKEANTVHDEIGTAALETAVTQQVNVELDKRTTVIKS